MNRLLSIVVHGIAVLALHDASVADIRFVNTSLRAGANDGSSWNDAYQGELALVAAIAASQPGDQIWVAQGTYVAGFIGLRTAAFTLRTGVEIYGGFAGTETVLHERDWSSNATILSGDLLRDDATGNRGDNSYHIVVSTSAQPSAVLDGFIIEGGNADGTGEMQDQGGGALIVGGKPTFRNCTFRDNFASGAGGGCAVVYAAATFTHCAFENNAAGYAGGGVRTYRSATEFRQCRVNGNDADVGGGMHLEQHEALLVNCLIHSNTAQYGGGGLRSTCALQAHSCTVADNVSHFVSGGGARFGDSLPTYVTNGVFWGNASPGDNWSSQINGASAVQVVLQFVTWQFAAATDPPSSEVFVDPANGDYRLSAYSIFVDAGSNALVPSGVTTDLAGQPRFVDILVAPDTGVGPGPIVDRGAYERAPRANCPGDVNHDGVVDGFDLGIVASSYGSAGMGDLNGDGRVDGADLGMLLSTWGVCE